LRFVVAVKNLILLALLTAATSLAQAPNHDLVTNLSYRIQRGDLGDIVPAPFESFRGLRIAKGGEALLKECLNNREKWSRDPLINRFGHHQPMSTIGCRERSSPSLHMVFFKTATGREVWLHFDLHGPGNLVGHAEEVMRNRLVFGRTSQYNVYRGLVRQEDGPGIDEVPPKRYDFGEHAREYLNQTFGPSTLGAAALTAAVSSGVHEVLGQGEAFNRYQNRVELNLVRQTMQKSIEFGASALLQQDEHFVTSNETAMGKRLRSALYRSFTVKGSNGDELAFPRIAAAVGTGWFMHEYHPWWPEHDPNPWLASGIMLSKYVMQSFWHEFRPEIKSRIREVEHRLLKK
jgi:hypothetical protein